MMSFTEEQIAALKAPLDRANVKTRTQGGSQVSYVEAYHAENEANRIFGFDAWDRETEIQHIGEREQDGKWRVYYRAKVRITVHAGDRKVIREGCGYGSGIDRDIGAAHESALKEAESDAEKRALKTFGNPFGQALYDKSQSEVADAPREKPKPATLNGTARETDHMALLKLNEVDGPQRLSVWFEDHREIIDSADDATKAVLRATYAAKQKQYPKPGTPTVTDYPLN
jgi:DNA repair and recombination protein RAD52